VDNFDFNKDDYKRYLEVRKKKEASLSLDRSGIKPSWVHPQAVFETLGTDRYRRGSSTSGKVSS
jgi:hypothetical protein